MQEKIKVVFTTLLIEKSPQALPLGAACVASSVKHNAKTKDLCNVKLLSFCTEDAELIKHSNSEEETAIFIANKIMQENPKVVGFSIFVWNRIILEKAAFILQENGVKVIAGGPEVTANPESFCKFDKVCIGEGEYKIADLVLELIQLKSSINMCNVKNENVTLSENKSQLQNAHLKNTDFTNAHLKNTHFTNAHLQNTDSALDNLPSPYLDGTLDPSLFEGALWELARGCPFKCSYCYESKGQKNVRMFSMDRIEKELELFAKKNVPQVFVLDPTYNANKKRAVELIKKIAKKTPNTFYYFEARAEFIDRELAHAFTKIPCSLQIGLQSADENVLRLVNRPFNKKAFLKGIECLNAEGVVFGLDVIYGLPGDSLLGFKNSVDFAISVYPNNLELFCLSVLPGTDLFDRAKELNLVWQEVPPYHIIHTNKFSKEDIKTASCIAKACNVFYNAGRAVPWFNTIIHTLHIKPADFFYKFYEYMKAQNICDKECDHKKIECFQKSFITQLFTKRNLNKLLPLALDIISYNGAISRKIDTGISETILLSYPAEYIDSEYSLDLNFFVKNVAKRSCRFTT